MRSFLETILSRKRQEVMELRRTGWQPEAERIIPPKRDFLSAIRKHEGLGIIAEVKKASPSKGIIRHDFNPVSIAESYQRAGADAVSVLTDEQFFQGTLSYLLDVRNVVQLPVLRKDFIIDTTQVEQTAAAGADAMLLIAAILDKIQLRDLFEASCELGIKPLIEIHHAGELDRVMAVDPDLVGINNRDLATFVTDISTTVELMRHIPPGVTVVSESGIENGGQARTVQQAGAAALLVGESFMRQDDPSALLAELRGA